MAEEQRRLQSTQSAMDKRRATLQGAKDAYCSFGDLSSFVRTTNQAPSGTQEKRKSKMPIRSSTSRRPVSVTAGRSRSSTDGLRPGAEHLSVLHGKVNIVGRLKHPQILLTQSFRGHEAISLNRAIHIQVRSQGMAAERRLTPPSLDEHLWTICGDGDPQLCAVLCSRLLCIDPSLR